MQCTYRRMHIGLYKCTSCTTRRRSISLFWTSIRTLLRTPPRSTSCSWKAFLFYHSSPQPNHPTAHNATPTFPSLGQAHRRLSESGVGEMAAGRPGTAPLPSGSVGSSPGFQRHHLLARSDGAGAPPGGRIRSAGPGSQVASTCRRRVRAPRVPVPIRRAGGAHRRLQAAPPPCPCLRVTFAARSGGPRRRAGGGGRTQLSFSFHTWATKKEATWPERITS